MPSGVRVFSDDELDALVLDFVASARLARDAGYQFVDIKACHGYLGHELLGARARQGKYGGSLENRMRFMRTVIDAVRAEVPGLLIGVRLSAFDMVPFRKRADGIGEPDPEAAAADHGFGLTPPGGEAALDDAAAVLRALEQIDVRWICITAGSPYYNPHMQRPALFPPLDGYLPPEDPLRGVARQIRGDCAIEGAVPGTRHRRVGIQLSAGVAAERRAACRGERHDRFRRPWPDGPRLSGPAGRCAQRCSAAPEVDLPDLQRLHDRTATRDGLRLLSAGSVLPGQARSRGDSEEAAEDRVALPGSFPLAADSGGADCVANGACRACPHRVLAAAACTVLSTPIFASSNSAPASMRAPWPASYVAKVKHPGWQGFRKR